MHRRLQNSYGGRQLLLHDRQPLSRSPEQLGVSL